MARPIRGTRSRFAAAANATVRPARTAPLIAPGNATTPSRQLGGGWSRTRRRAGRAAAVDPAGATCLPACRAHTIDRRRAGAVRRGPPRVEKTERWFAICRPRPLGRLGSGRLPAFHLPPINPVVSRGPYPFRVGKLFLGRGSRLDAFSGSPVRTWLPSGAGCPTTGPPAVRPARSSRTRASPPQLPNARGG